MPDKMTPGEAREYLANVASSGETDWHPTKDLADYKDAQVVRKAEEFRRQERAGLPISNREARGHGKTEHGKAVTDGNRQAYEVARSGVEVSFERVEGARGEVYIGEVSATSREDAEAALDIIDRVSPDAHIQIKYQDVEGGWHLIYGKNGRSAESLRDAIDDYADIEDFLAAESSDDAGYGAPEGSGYTPGAGSFSFVIIAR